MNENNIKLSICIPVYNCADFLGQALDSILSQANKQTEVIVYDGGSTDETPQLMKGYLESWGKCLYYYRGDCRGGIDADMAKCVSYANGEYCWLFSGDDVMRQGSITEVVNEIKSEHDVYICKHTICDKNMKISHEHPVLKTQLTNEADFKHSDQRLVWFALAESNEAFFSFISGLIIKKSTWDSGKLMPEFNGSCWAHVARLFEISKSGLKVKYIPNILLDQRGDNDSFADRGTVNRFKIGIEGYHRIADHFFGPNSKEAFHIRRVIRNEFKLRFFLSAKIQAVRKPTKESKVLLDKLLEMAYQDKSATNLMVRVLYKTFPHSIFLVARLFYRGYKKLKMKIKNA